MTYDDEFSFPVGLRAYRAEHRSTDVNGRPVDVSTEGDTARSERIWALQDRWQPRQAPAADPAAVLAEWAAASPANRMSPFLMRVAENPGLMPAAESDPHPGQAPRPGGLLEKMAAQMAERGARARRNLGR